MNPQAPPFDSPVEVVAYIISTPNAPGIYHYYVYGWDGVPNYNNSAPFATLVIEDDMPPKVSSVLVDGLAFKTVSAGTTVTLTATVDDSSTGNSSVGGANYTIGSQSWPGINMSAISAPFDSSTEAVTASVSTIGWAPGSYYLYVYGWDSATPSANYNVTSVAFATITISSPTNNAPILNWTGEANYENDGLDPESGNTSTHFVFRIKYTDADDQAPQTGHPRIVVLRDGSEILNESMEPVNADDTNYADGKLYMKTISLSIVSNGFSYYFMANDYAGLTALTPVKDAPDVTTNPDSDGDGLPDSWEQEMFGNLQQTANGDPDGDGYANLQEWQSGTDPQVSDRKAVSEFPRRLFAVLFTIIVAIPLLILLIFMNRRRK